MSITSGRSPFENVAVSPACSVSVFSTSGAVCADAMVREVSGNVSPMANAAILVTVLVGTIVTPVVASDFGLDAERIEIFSCAARLMLSIRNRRWQGEMPGFSLLPPDGVYPLILFIHVSTTAYI
ncbi:hypothetical protein ACEN19_04340 [Corynebacterium auriscanis]|uniref:hypothetical protein n=1 Tax=Corynebacterium auriscanis TaxID=99807 RepID=UPI003CED81D2